MRRALCSVVIAAHKIARSSEREIKIGKGMCGRAHALEYMCDSHAIYTNAPWFEHLTHLENLLEKEIITNASVKSWQYLTRETQFSFRQNICWNEKKVTVYLRHQLNMSFNPQDYGFLGTGGASIALVFTCETHSVGWIMPPLLTEPIEKAPEAIISAAPWWSIESNKGSFHFSTLF